MAVVQVVTEDGRALDVAGGELVIGRCADADLSLDDPQVTRHHARLEVHSDGTVLIRDSGSRHGTFLNGHRITGPTPVRLPARVDAGGATVWLLPPTPAPSAAVPPARAPQSGDQPAPPPPTHPVPWPPPTPVVMPPVPRRRAGLTVGIVVMALLGLLILLVAIVEVGTTGAFVSLLLAALPAPLVFVFVRLTDRHEPEPPGLLALVFLYGATAAVFFAGTLNVIGEGAVTAVLGPGVGEFFGLTVAAPVFEETLKGAALLMILLRRRTEFNGVIDGLVYGAVVGMGFAVSEDLFFYVEAMLEGADEFAATVVVRGVFSPFAHSLFTALTGIGLALALERPQRPWLPALGGLAGAMGLHALWNGSAFLGLLPILYFVVFVPMFVAVLIVARRAMRWESRLIQRMLSPDSHTGLLAPAEIATLASASARRRVARQASQLGGPPAKRRAREYQHAATELAFVRRRIEVAGHVSPQHRAEEAHLRERLWRLKAGLGSAAVPPSTGVVSS